MSLLDTASLIVTPNGYKEGKLYSVIPSDGSGDMSVTRATTATRVNSAGLVESVANNIPRLDYSNGTCPSLLVEPQRTNSSLYSEDLTNAYWNKFNTSISANTTTAPSGIATADKVIENTANSFHYVESVNSLTFGNTYAISCFLKKAEREYGYIGVYTFESKQIRVNLNDGTITSTTGTWLSTSVEDYGNGWYRVIGTFSAYATTYFFTGPALDGSTPTYTGNGTSGIYIWGAQLEAGSYATSYIPTTSASVTRNADELIKTSATALIGQTEGTILLDVYRKANSEFIVFFSKGTTTPQYVDVIYFYQTTNGNFIIECYKNNVLQFNLPLIGGLNVGNNKIALAYSQTDIALYVNGFLTATDNYADLPEMNNICINTLDIINTANFGMNVLALWKTRLTNTQLAQLTSI